MDTAERRGVALGGFMAVGKSSVGRALAARLGLPFVDSDALLEARWGSPGRQIREEGESTFRARERAILSEIASGPPAVVATGGGAWVDPRNRALLRRGHVLVVLHAPLEILRQRARGSDRPLFDEDAAALLASRRAAYEDADLRVDTGMRSVDEAVEEIATWLRNG